LAPGRALIDRAEAHLEAGQSDDRDAGLRQADVPARGATMIEASAIVAGL
jgi:hypothetical protein